MGKMGNKKQCGQCKYCGFVVLQEQYACYVYPPAIHIIPGKEFIVSPPMVQRSYRPRVTPKDMSCGEFHEVFDEDAEHL